VESGRSTPSRATLLAIADALDVPFRDRNPLLLAAGYAPAYRDDSWDAPQMAAITAAAARLLQQQEPYSAVLMDRHWNVLSTNAAAPRFFGLFVDLAARAGPRNILHLTRTCRWYRSASRRTGRCSATSPWSAPSARRPRSRRRTSASSACSRPTRTRTPGISPS
jgi:transcriptional regulator with XRE-family HTH domain